MISGVGGCQIPGILAVSQEYVELGEQLLLLQSGDEVAVIPPSTGGSVLEPPEKDMSEVEEKSKDIIKFTAETLSVDGASQLVTSPHCGAISLFVGTTRSNSEGKKVMSLESEAYIPMAGKEVRRICRDIRQKWPVRSVAVFHRHGSAPVSEASSLLCRRPTGLRSSRLRAPPSILGMPRCSYRKRKCMKNHYHLGRETRNAFGPPMSKSLTCLEC